MKRLHTMLFAALAAAALASPARADDATRMGISLGVRGAYAWPFGNITGDIGPVTNKLSDSVDRMIPLWVEGTFRVGGGMELGPYFSYGWITGKNGGGDAKDYRLGAQLNYRLTPAGGMVPWLGVGAGWEWVSPDNKTIVGGQTFDSSVSGLELMVQGGADFRVTQYAAIGPFVSFSFGRYSSGDIFDTAKTGGVSVGKAWHEWLQVGAKLSLDL